MSKVKTRKSISLNRETYMALQRAAGDAGKSMAHYIEDLLRAAGLPISEHVHYAPNGEGKYVSGAATALPKTNGERRYKAIAAIRAAVSAYTRTESVRKQREYEQAAIKNPCRRERCSILGLHPAHEATP